MDTDNTTADEANRAMDAALRALPSAEETLGRVQILAMLEERPGEMFFCRMELSTAGPTHDVCRSTLHPSQRYLDIIAAVRAGNLDWKIEEAA